MRITAVHRTELTGNVIIVVQLVHIMLITIQRLVHVMIVNTRSVHIQVGHG